MTTWSIQEHWFPETWTTGRRLACWGEQIDRVEEFFMVHPDARKASKQVNSLPSSFQTVPSPMLPLRCVSNASIGMHHKELFDPVNLFLRPGPSPSCLFRFQGASVLELVKLVGKMSAVLESFKMFTAGPPNAGLALPLHISKQSILPEAIKRVWSAKSGILAHRSLSQVFRALIITVWLNCKVLHEDQMSQYQLLEIDVPTGKNQMRCTCLVLFCITHLRSPDK